MRETFHYQKSIRPGGCLILFFAGILAGMLFVQSHSVCFFKDGLSKAVSLRRRLSVRAVSVFGLSRDTALCTFTFWRTFIFTGDELGDDD